MNSERFRKFRIEVDFLIFSKIILYVIFLFNELLNKSISSEENVIPMFFTVTCHII